MVYLTEMASKIRTELTIPSLADAIDEELQIFDEQFAEIQPDKMGMSRPEKGLLRTYLIWKLHVRSGGAEPE